MRHIRARPPAHALEEAAGEDAGRRRDFHTACILFLYVELRAREA